MMIGGVNSKIVSKAGRRVATWIIFILLASACVEPYFPTIDLPDNGVLVVDGFLVSNDSSVIKLSRAQGFDSLAISSRESNAHVEVVGVKGDSYVFTERTKGVYVAPQLNLDVTQQYKLRILTQNEKEYESDFVDIRQSALLDSITKTELQEHDRIGFYIYAHDPANKARNYYWTYDETYEYSSLDISVYYFENGQIIPRKYAAELNLCYKTIYNNDFYLGSTAGLSQDLVYRFPLIEIPQNALKFYYGYSILVKQYAITDEAYSYYAVTKRNSENLGSLFDPIPSQPESNLRCVNSPSTPVIGFFSASTISKSRLFFTRQQITGPRIPFANGQIYGPSEYTNCERKVLTLADMTAENLEGMLIYDRVFDKITFELIGYGVSQQECLDCRYKGGVLQAPDYWK